ncbi:MAG: PepSY-like domain-containing protein [Muribaculaceae bacterium]|nr:PepSY-like domain-containing protein [Muribaculaceae bacterium]
MRINSNFIYSFAVFISLFSAAEMSASEPSRADSLSMRTGMTDWIDPVKAVPDGCIFVSYPSPQRGDSTEASCLVYLPPSYSTDSLRSFPVIYYLHGGTGNQREVRWLVDRVDPAIRSGKMQPVIIVSPQALPIGWYINANVKDPKVTSGPIEDVLIKDLIPYVDSHFRTVPSKEGRGIEGFSMGGRGALMLAFKHPDKFGAASSVAGAVVNWDEEPLERALQCTFGDTSSPLSKIYFNAWHPATFACQNNREIIGSKMNIRLTVGDADRLYNENGNHITDRFHNMLDSLGIAHSYTIVPGANHNPEEIFESNVNTYDTSFWDKAFASTNTADMPSGLIDFAKEIFPGERILVWQTIDDPRGDHYSLTLKNGTRVKLNEHLKWIDVERGDFGTIPSSMIHAGIQKYLDKNHISLNSVTRIEKIPRVGYEVTFSNAKKLTFNTNGELI